jgi:hypothetical protein
MVSNTNALTLDMGATYGSNMAVNGGDTLVGAGLQQL